MASPEVFIVVPRISTAEALLPFLPKELPARLASSLQFSDAGELRVDGEESSCEAVIVCSG